MSPHEKYAQQPYPLFIIGDYTTITDEVTDNFRGTQTEYGSDIIDFTEDICIKMMDAYEYYDRRKGKDKNNTSFEFWNLIRKIEKALGNESDSCAWTKIDKYAIDGRSFYQCELNHFNSIRDLTAFEISIIEPKICIFISSDINDIDYFFGETQNACFFGAELLPINGFKLDELCQLKHNDLPELTFRVHTSCFNSDGLLIQFLETMNIPVQSQTPPSQKIENSEKEKNLKMLKELGELKIAGILTEEEFAEKKKELLSKI